MAVGMWESEGTDKGEGGVEAIGSRQPEERRGKGGDDREWGGDNTRTVDRGGIDTEENGMERRRREGDADSWLGQFLSRPIDRSVSPSGRVARQQGSRSPRSPTPGLE